MTTGSLNYTGRVVLVTGGGKGIGASHAREFGRRDASVVVNDVDQTAAAAIVQEITATGGTAIANTHSVLDGEAVIDAAISAFGRLDVVVHNAGIQEFSAIDEMTLESWQRVLAVNLEGVFRCCRAAWPVMRQQQYGRMLFTSSPVVAVGDKTFPHYVASKAGVLALARSLAIQGREDNIFCNAVQPFASGGMLKEHAPEKYWQLLSPDYIAAMAALLCHESSTENGACFELGGGYIHKVRTQMSAGVYIPEADYSAEAIAANMDKIGDFSANSIACKLGDWSTVWNEVMARIGDELLQL